MTKKQVFYNPTGRFCITILCMISENFISFVILLLKQMYLDIRMCIYSYLKARQKY